MEKILILGYDGYLGNALTQKLLFENYDVIGIDSLIKRDQVKSIMKTHSAIEYMDPSDKDFKFKDLGKFKSYNLDISSETVLPILKDIIVKNEISTIVNLAHNPSAAFSMISADLAANVLRNNILGINNILWAIKETNPDIHLINLGTMGEFDHAANVTVPEGYFNVEIDGRKSEEMIFPRRPGSIYHSSKVAMTYIIDFLTRAWDLKCTDIMQAVVYGLYTKETEKTKIYSPLNVDEAFGTVLNRFIVQAKLNLPLTVYGDGDHSRGFLSLNDSIQALMIAIKNQPKKSKVRVWNQLSDWHSMNDLALTVKDVVKTKFNVDVQIKHVETPRKENTSNHYYNLKTDILKSLGYKPTRTIKDEIEYMYSMLDNKCIEDLKVQLEDPKIKFMK